MFTSHLIVEHAPGQWQQQVHMAHNHLIVQISQQPANRVHCYTQHSLCIQGDHMLTFQLTL